MIYWDAVALDALTVGADGSDAIGAYRDLLAKYGSGVGVGARRVGFTGMQYGHVACLERNTVNVQQGLFEVKGGLAQVMFRELMDVSKRCSRIDICYTRRGAALRKLMPKWWEYLKSWQLKPKRVERETSTFYVGADGADKLVRIYEKIDGEDEGVRIELQLRNRRASDVAFGRGAGGTLTDILVSELSHIPSPIMGALGLDRSTAYVPFDVSYVPETVDYSGWSKYIMGAISSLRNHYASGVFPDILAQVEEMYGAGAVDQLCEVLAVVEKDTER